MDDATGALMELLFCESESALSYFAAMRSYLEQHGKPVALYSDKAGVFRVNQKEPSGGAGVTQSTRAVSSLNIDIVCASTPAAKGRVERAHLTLQDRLVKELRLRAHEGECVVERGARCLDDSQCSGGQVCAGPTDCTPLPSGIPVCTSTCIDPG